MRIAVLSDVHSNLPALEAVIATVGAVDAWYHLGDVVGYGPHPDEVVGRLRDLGAVGVRGNHDAAATGAIDTEWFNAAARWAIDWTMQRIAPETRDWLASLPEVRTLGDHTLVHGSRRDPTWEYITSEDEAIPSFDLLETPILLHGHTHYPAAWLEKPPGRAELVQPADQFDLALGEQRLLLNPGSVGQPRDGDRRASVMVIDTDGRRARWQRVAYAIDSVQADMRKAGHPQMLVQRLAAGW